MRQTAQSKNFVLDVYQASGVIKFAGSCQFSKKVANLEKTIKMLFSQTPN